MKQSTATKIICTLGPASADQRTIEKMIRNGMSVARLNFSHGTHTSHGALITRVRAAAERQGRPIAIMQDLCGPKIRVGKLRGGSVTLKTGATVEIVGTRETGSESRLSINSPRIIRDLKAGNRVFLADGELGLRVVNVEDARATLKVIRGGELGEGKGINLPDTDLSLPSLTAKDRKDIAFGVKHGVDIVALSFVRTAGDVVELRRLMKRLGSDAPILAKLEKPEAVRNLAKIIDTADGVMVARGDLGVELPLQDVPVIQKQITLAAGAWFKPAVVATQMLESMTTNPRPTRAEASDVANAIFEGADAVMLSGETAAGKYPVEVVKMMTAIIRAAEHSWFDHPQFTGELESSADFASAVAEAAVQMAHDIHARVIACFTRSGLTARLISKQGSSIPIVAFTSDKKVLTRMPILRGVTPVLMPMIRSVDQIIVKVEECLKERRAVRSGDKIVIVASAPVAAYGQTNMLKLHDVV